MPSPNEDAEHYRQVSARFRSIASVVHQYERRKYWLRLSDDYAKLAEESENRASSVEERGAR